MTMDSRTAETLEWDALRARMAGWAACSLGEARLKALAPLESPAAVHDRLERVAELIALIERNGRVPLGGLEDIGDVVAAAAPMGVALGPEGWTRLLRFLGVVQRIADFAAEHDETLPRLREMAGRLHPNGELAAAIERVFDEDGLVRDNASPELASIRSELRRAEGAIMRTLQRIVGSLKGAGVLQEEYWTLRNGRHVVPVRAGSRGRVPGIVHGSSASGETLYIEPAEVVEAANDAEILRQREEDEVMRILRALTAELRPHLPELRADLDTLGELDLLNALARIACERGWKVPLAVERGAVKLYSAHHPLLQIEPGRRSIPITLALDASDRAVVLSGPNAGGKTTAMKTLALNALLLQSGSPIPASPDSQLPFFDGFFADIGDQQDLGEGVSTFTGHLKRVKDILNIVTHRSLVLLDELGTGTDPEEGGALAQAILETLMEHGALTIATSHLGPLKHWAEVTPGARNASFSLDESTHRPTFRLRLDLPGASEALQIAENEGMPRELLARARALVGEQKIQLGELLRRIEARERDLAILVKDTSARAAALEEQERIAKRRAEELREEKRALHKRAGEEAEKAAREVRERFEKMIANLPGEEELAQRRRMLADGRKGIIAEQGRLAAWRKEADADRDNAVPAEARPGRRVFVPAFGKWGEVVWADADSGRARVMVGNVEVEVGLQSLRDKEPPKQPVVRREDNESRGPKQKKSRRVKAALEELASLPPEAAGPAFNPRRRHHKPISAPVAQEPLRMELDLHGYRADDAIAELDRYLDRALLAGYPKVRIIHGTGQGKLYRVVHEFLRDFPAVRRFRFGGTEEGGGGVTVVEF
jgi:DNA mismatch repair protein MutS2